MEDATAMVKLVSQFGVLVVIAGVFLYTYLQDRKDQKKKEEVNVKRDDEYRTTIKLLADSTNNVAKALDLLREAEHNTTVLIQQHDQRSIAIKEDLAKGFGEIKNDLVEVKTIVENCRRN